jgi:hypothetical protein
MPRIVRAVVDGRRGHEPDEKDQRCAAEQRRQSGHSPDGRFDMTVDDRDGDCCLHGCSFLRETPAG